MTWRLLLNYILWLGPLPFLAAIAIAMQRRGWVRQFPFFFGLVLLDLMSFASGWFIAHRPGGTYVEYFINYWTMSALKNVLRFGVLYEVFRHTLKDYDALRHFSRRLFQWGAVALFGVAIVTAAVAPGQGLGGAVRPIVMLERSVVIVQVGLLLLLFVCVTYLRLPWQHQAFGIALGMGVYVGISLAAVAVLTAMGHDEASLMFRFVKPGAHMCAVLLWAAYLVPAHAAAPKTAAVPHHALQRWNEALLQFLRR